MTPSLHNEIYPHFCVFAPNFPSLKSNLPTKCGIYRIPTMPNYQLASFDYNSSIFNTETKTVN